MSKLMMAMVVGLTCVSASAQAQDYPQRNQQPKSQGALNESQALGAALASNVAAYQTAVIAAARATDPEVRTYAMGLVQDYEKANRDLLKLVEKGTLTATDSPMRDKIVSTANKDMGNMWTGEAGAELDKQFLTYMIEDQRNDIQNLESSLIPSATNTDLKDAFESGRKVTNEHFQEACTLGRRLGSNVEGCPAVRGTE